MLRSTIEIENAEFLINSLIYLNNLIANAESTINKKYRRGKDHRFTSRKRYLSS